MAPILYLVAPSPPVRAVQVTAKALGLTLDERPLDLNKGENLTPEYLKLNPQHTVPTLVDDGFPVWDSHAINAYLVTKYGKDDSLYPKNPQKRATVDQRLHFDSGVAFPALLKLLVPIIHGDKNSVEDSELKEVDQLYTVLEAFLDGKKWFAGDSVTIADHNFLATIGTLHVIVAIDGGKYPRLAAWLNNVEALPEAEANTKGLGLMTEKIRAKIP